MCTLAAALFVVGCGHLEVAEVTDDSTGAEPSPTGGGGSVAVTNPLAGLRLWVDPSSSARRQVAAWSASRPADAQIIDKIASQSIARWFGDWDPSLRGAVDKYVTTVAGAGAVPVMVAYNIPNRDCGGYSAGGAASDAAYLTWVSEFSGGIAGRKAVIILEPDALGTHCNTAARMKLMAEAVRIFKQNTRAVVYIDAGHANWVPASTMAWRLKQAGLASADGFALNVSNFYTDAQNIVYGTAVSGFGLNKHFILDTSRNGAGWNGEWCNPTSRKIGQLPLTNLNHPLVDAVLWIKTPGNSDGLCNGGPRAGTWWPEYALELAR